VHGGAISAPRLLAPPGAAAEGCAEARASRGASSDAACAPARPPDCPTSPRPPTAPRDGRAARVRLKGRYAPQHAGANGKGIVPSPVLPQTTSAVASVAPALSRLHSGPGSRLGQRMGSDSPRIAEEGGGWDADFDHAREGWRHGAAPSVSRDPGLTGDDSASARLARASTFVAGWGVVGGPLGASCPPRRLRSAWAPPPPRARAPSAGSFPGSRRAACTDAARRARRQERGAAAWTASGSTKT
jgi:hypothetical protein